MHKLLPYCEKIPGPSQHFQVTQWITSILNPLMEKENMMLLTAELRKNNLPPHKKVPKTASAARSSHSNVKKKPQAQKKGQGKAPAPKTYSKGYRISKTQQDAMENVFQMARTMMESQQKEKARLKYQK
ncbi:hypothetical protein O181_014109 [Austropuccinia psidii MF-1]|uniref:Uncharacterized protein n=1 Tax=Austropuccinia psidii MF-1 TaxID=1389203 RepID=A0A9Q3BZI5_9BASI|nr:hypothetical protein [Austropuccinia psidii MF-1]